ncbi:MAG: DnaJ domain-containing protein, partial [Candidatus Acidiferrales bacterium]
PKTQRRYPRHTAPKWMLVAWEAAGHRTVSRAETVGMGGLFFHTPDPPANGSQIRLLFDLQSGEIRARAIVRDSRPDDGMGVQFVQMEASDRLRLDQFLAQYAKVQVPAAAKPPNRRPSAAEASTKNYKSVSAETAETLLWVRELDEKLKMSREGTHYQLLGIPSESSTGQIKQSFYAIARKFHPDHHMAKSGCIEPLKELMGAVTVAYKTLSHRDKRAAYDAHLASSSVYNLRRTHTAAQKSIEDCFLNATQCLRAGNFVGSITWLRNCVELAPDDAKYRSLLARSLATIPQYRNEAVEQYKRAAELDPWNVRVLLQFAELYEDLQLPLNARALYTKILKIDPLNAQARLRTITNTRK